MARPEKAGTDWPTNATDAERDAARAFWLAHPSLLLPGAAIADVPKVWAAAFDLDAGAVAELCEPFLGNLRVPPARRNSPSAARLNSEPSALELAGLNAEAVLAVLFADRNYFGDIRALGRFECERLLPDLWQLPEKWHACRGRTWTALVTEPKMGLLRLFAGDVELLRAFGPIRAVKTIKKARNEGAVATYLAHVATSFKR